MNDNIKKVKVRIKLLPSYGFGELPRYATEGSSGFDLIACNGEDIIMRPGERSAIPTGICIEIPGPYELQVRPRSGLALNHGITVLNSPGTVDSDYRGEIKVILINLSGKCFTVKRGMRIAQAVIAEYKKATLQVAEELDSTERGPGGFGHTDG